MTEDTRKTRAALNHKRTIDRYRAASAGRDDLLPVNLEEVRDHHVADIGGMAVKDRLAERLILGGQAVADFTDADAIARRCRALLDTDEGPGLDVQALRVDLFQHRLDPDKAIAKAIAGAYDAEKSEDLAVLAHITREYVRAEIIVQKTHRTLRLIQECRDTRDDPIM